MKLLIGLAAGAAVIYFLQTEKGKEFVEGLKKEYGNVGESLFSYAGDLLKKGQSYAGKAAEQASNLV